MARRPTLAYIVQPFVRDAKSRLCPGHPTRHTDETHARRTAAALSRAAQGVALLAMEVSEELDFCGEPRLVSVWGEIPVGAC